MNSQASHSARPDRQADLDPAAWAAQLRAANINPRTGLATDVGGVRELVGDAGLIVPPKDSPALAEALLKAMSMPEMARKTMQRDARRRIQMHYSMPVKAEEWDRLYLEILAGKAT